MAHACRCLPRSWPLMAGLFTLTLPGAVHALSPDIVISQVYGGGGNAGATYTHDFIELYNRGPSAVPINGWSVQYASSTGSTWQKTDIDGTIQPGGYFLIQEGQGAGGTQPLPAPNAIGTILMSANMGKVALLSNRVVLSGTCPSSAALVDLVGFGAANCSETSPTPALSNSTAALRNGFGAQETDNNLSDFSVGAR
jgi:predicted extracellular nuclease